MNPRYNALTVSAKRNRPKISEEQSVNTSAHFGIHVFNRSTMQKMLPREVYKNVLNAIDGREKIKREYADAIAVAMKEWAISHGATHYSHWFQPLTGATAEKHDAFIDWIATDQVIEKFNGKQLIQGEPDASSFPSGGLRSTYEARGYTGWDPTSPAFVWNGGDGVTLCIPSVFFSWTGDALDSKIPLLRSDALINEAALRLLRWSGIEASHVYSTLGCEQEYFVVDRAWRNLRPDLIMAGRTVFGAPSPKGQELQDHYFGAVKDRILYFMRDFELTALKLGIPVKTRHNEVAPAQHEVAPVYERSSVAVDHNILLMELMRQTAVKHDLSCLLHEKPFHGINGSGKHCNWSLSTDTGINLLDPSDTPESNVHFLILLTAILHAVHEHSTLLRASIGSAANDFRLGGHEAPPAIMSVYLGEALEEVVENLTAKGSHTSPQSKKEYDLGTKLVAGVTRDNTDRNRTSPFAFTGNKFEFRAVGASSSPAFPVTVLNVIVAESLNRILDEIEAKLPSKGKTTENLMEAALPVLRKFLKASRNILFSGDNYSEEWMQEAQKRNLPILKKSVDAFEALVSDKTMTAFKGILTPEELNSRHAILSEGYSHTVNIEMKLMIDIFRTQILPAALKQQHEMASSIQAYAGAMGTTQAISRQKAMLEEFSALVEKGIETCKDLELLREHAEKIDDVQAQSKSFCKQVMPKGEELRAIVDSLESHVADGLWPLPKYRELLFCM